MMKKTLLAVCAALAAGSALAYPDKPVTMRAAETRMGSGKGAVDHYVAAVRPGRVVLEIAGVSEEDAREAMRLASHKLPMRTQFIEREDYS